MNLSILTMPQKLMLGGIAFLLFAGTIVGGVWYIYSKGEKAAEAKAIARQAKSEANIAKAVGKSLDKLQAGLDANLNTGFNKLGTRIGDIDITERTIIRPTLIKEIQNDTQLSDPNFVLPDGVRNIINKARAESACPERATGGDCATLSRAAPAR